MKWLVLFLLLLLVGCDSDPKYPRVDQKDVGVSIGSYYLHETSIDGCDYLFIDGYRSFSMTHKGNCKACANKVVVITDTFYVEKK